MNLIVDKNGINENEKISIKNSIIENKVFPFYYEISTTPKFPFFVHTLAKRNDKEVNINSSAYYFFFEILKKFCKRNKIKFKQVIRAAINATFADHRFSYLDPHIDFKETHKVVIMYLNDVYGGEDYNSTLIFNEKYDGTEIYDVQNLKKDFTIREEIIPEFGKIICFDGAYYHTIKPPYFGEVRFICVFNII